jgi:hypothetical protein
MALKSLSTAELLRELARRDKSAAKLEAQRDKLLEELEQINAQLAIYGVAALRGSVRSSTPAAAGGKRTRARNAVSLPDAITMAMEIGAVVSPNEASDLLISNGFKTTSQRFNMMVSNALAKDKRFKRISRGQYERIG